jgi:DNA repair protein RadD
VDEADLVGAKTGMYKNFFGSLEGAKILGLTATPYRLTTDMQGSILKFLTRTRPRIFDELVYYVQTSDLFEEGYLAKLEYQKVKGFDRHAVKVNSTGADFDDRALQLHFFKIGFSDKIVKVVERLQEVGRKNALIFTRFVPEAEYVASKVEGCVVVTAETPKAEREAIGKEFRAGRIWGVINVGVYLVGFDYPELETVVLARPTRSLRVYYQSAGRGVRPHPAKESTWIVDMVGLSDEFGRLEDLRLSMVVTGSGLSRTPNDNLPTSTSG